MKIIAERGGVYPPSAGSLPGEDRMPPNWVNRTLWTGDNLDILRGMNSECVDLIYLDPPFNSNRDYEAPIGSKAAGAGRCRTIRGQSRDGLR